MGWNDEEGVAVAAVVEETLATRPEPSNALAALLRRPVTITVGVAWDESIKMRFALERPGTWDVQSRLERIIASGLSAGESDPDVRCEALLDCFALVASDAVGVPGFDPRRTDETQHVFGQRIRRYFSEAGAPGIVASVMDEYWKESLAPEVARREQFRS